MYNAKNCVKQLLLLFNTVFTDNLEIDYNKAVVLTPLTPPNTDTTKKQEFLLRSSCFCIYCMKVYFAMLCRAVCRMMTEL